MWKSSVKLMQAKAIAFKQAMFWLVLLPLLQLPSQRHRCLWLLLLTAAAVLQLYCLTLCLTAAACLRAVRCLGC
jgi:threonine/homoserine/homoserine lactone efflux protein